MQMTIYVPDDLKAQIDEVKDEVNWSALACRAFREKVVELLMQRKETLDMEEVIQRLKVSKEKEQSELFKLGYELGQKWASNDAEVGELKKLEDARDPREGWYFDDPRFRQQGSDAERFYFILYPTGEDVHGNTEDDFWGWQVDNGEQHGPGFVRGFAEGAMSIWEQVRGKI